LRSWRTLVPLAAAAGVAVLVLKLSDGGFQSFSARRHSPPGTSFESQVKARAEADSPSSAMAFGSGSPASAPPAPSTPLDRSVGAGSELGTAPAPDADAALSAPVPIEGKKLGVGQLADESADQSAEAPPAVEGTIKEPAQEPATWGEVTAPTTPPPPSLAKEEQEKASESPPPTAESIPKSGSSTREMLRAKDQGNQVAGQSQAPAAASPPPPVAARGHLDPIAALSIATLALEVGDLTGARMALQDLPTLPADSLTARAAVLALTLAERSQELADCRAARERADALVEAAPSGALADTLRVRRAALPCPH